jgi:hypothetical protein
MIIRSTDGEPEVLDADDLQRLHVELTPGHGLGRLGEIDGDHAWLAIDALRRAGAVSASSPDWADRFDAMIDYAAGKGWLDPSGASVRAHIERT